MSDGEVTVGFSLGTFREKYPVKGFRITRHPVTRGDYEQCVTAGLCPEVNEGCLRISSAFGKVGDNARSPMTCVDPTDAEAYCRSVGGRLPSISEWFLAARGSEVSRFSWGDALPRCGQHPGASTYYSDHTGEPVRPEFPKCVSAAGDREVGKHPEGKSPSGVEDVLLTPSELVAGDALNPFGSCATGAMCVVYGLSAGSIDAVGGIIEAATNPGLSDMPEPRRDHGFRCAFDGVEP